MTPARDFGVELIVRNHSIDEPHVERLTRRIAAAQEPHLSRSLFADYTRQIRGAPSRID